jgi:hypothetical protein
MSARAWFRDCTKLENTESVVRIIDFSIIASRLVIGVSAASAVAERVLPVLRSAENALRDIGVFALLRLVVWHHRVTASTLFSNRMTVSVVGGCV